MFKHAWISGSGSQNANRAAKCESFSRNYIGIIHCLFDRHVEKKPFYNIPVGGP